MAAEQAVQTATKSVFREALGYVPVFAGIVAGSYITKNVRTAQYGVPQYTVPVGGTTLGVDDIFDVGAGIGTFMLHPQLRGLGAGIVFGWMLQKARELLGNPNYLSYTSSNTPLGTDIGSPTGLKYYGYPASNVRGGVPQAIPRGRTAGGGILGLGRKRGPAKRGYFENIASYDAYAYEGDAAGGDSSGGDSSGGGGDTSGGGDFASGEEFLPVDPYSAQGQFPSDSYDNPYPYQSSFASLDSSFVAGNTPPRGGEYLPGTASSDLTGSAGISSWMNTGASRANTLTIASY